MVYFRIVYVYPSPPISSLSLCVTPTLYLSCSLSHTHTRSLVHSRIFSLHKCTRSLPPLSISQTLISTHEPPTLPLSVPNSAPPFLVSPASFHRKSPSLISGS